MLQNDAEMHAANDRNELLRREVDNGFHDVAIPPHPFSPTWSLNDVIAKGLQREICNQHNIFK